MRLEILQGYPRGQKDVNNNVRAVQEIQELTDDGVSNGLKHSDQKLKRRQNMAQSHRDQELTGRENSHFVQIPCRFY